MEATFLASYVDPSLLPADGLPQIAMIGRSNVGKSSLVNHLTERKQLARISSSPGRTRTLNVYSVESRFLLVDLPGYGYARTSHQQREAFLLLMQNYLLHAPTLRLIFLVIDARIPFSALDRSMALWLQGMGLPFAFVLNKMDKVRPADLAVLTKVLEADFPGVARYPHSFVSADHRRTLLQVIEGVL